VDLRRQQTTLLAERLHQDAGVDVEHRDRAREHLVDRLVEALATDTDEASREIGEKLSEIRVPRRPARPDRRCAERSRGRVGQGLHGNGV
jgi:hypothetical protein